MLLEKISSFARVNNYSTVKSKCPMAYGNPYSVGRACRADSGRIFPTLQFAINKKSPPSSPLDLRTSPSPLPGQGEKICFPTKSAAKLKVLALTTWGHSFPGLFDLLQSCTQTWIIKIMFAIFVLLLLRLLHSIISDMQLWPNPGRKRKLRDCRPDMGGKISPSNACLKN